MKTRSKSYSSRARAHCCRGALLVALLAALPLGLFRSALVAQTDYPLLVIPQPIIGGGASDDNATLALNGSATVGVGRPAQVYGGSCQITEAYVAIDTVTSAQSLTVRIEDMSTSGVGDTTADATCAIASPAVGVNTCNFGSPTTKSQGANIVAYVNWTSTTGDILIEAMASQSDVLNTRYGLSQTNSKDRINYPAIALKCSDGRFLTSLFGATFQVDYQEKGFDSNDTDIDEIAQIISVGEHDLTAVGVCWNGNAAADIEMDITNTSGVSQCTGGDCGTFDDAWVGQTSFELNHCFPYSESVTLSANTDYMISLRTTTTTANALQVVTFTPGNALLRAMSPGGPFAVIGAASRVDEGSWVIGANDLWSGGPNAEDVYPNIFVVIGGVEDPGAGGGTVSYGSVQ